MKTRFYPFLLLLTLFSCAGRKGGELPVTELPWQQGWGDQGNGTYINPVLKASPVYLRFTYDAKSENFQFLYSTDGESFHEVGEPFCSYNANWKGVRPALYAFNAEGDGGEALFDDFIF